MVNRVCYVEALSYPMIRLSYSGFSFMVIATVAMIF